MGWEDGDPRLLARNEPMKEAPEGHRKGLEVREMIGE